MERKAFLLLLCPFLFPSVSAAAACDPIAPRIKVDQLYRGYQIDRSVDGRNLERIGNKSVGSNKEMMGLTVSGLSYSMQLSTSVAQSGGRFCGSVSDINVQFGAKDPIKVYIASGVAQGSCDDRVTVKHELQHVSFIEHAIVTGSSRIKSAVSNSLAGKTFVGSSQNDVVAQAKQMIAGVIDRELDKVASEMNARHASIDTDEAYSKTSAICRGR
ncbi:hypothetical protein [Mesorhizobium sp. SP-1A]|uniref:hypothetical protein n=1 Tax=Mesorhizobium sp. SP-1A TaxID=3077840 RepID=UPI0028F6EED6|nr:hypothetical protein [Mesorhizobium sp. SP-1A]